MSQTNSSNTPAIWARDMGGGPIEEVPAEKARIWLGNKYADVLPIWEALLAGEIVAARYCFLATDRAKLEGGSK